MTKPQTLVDLYEMAPCEPSRWIKGDIHVRKIVRWALKPFRDPGPRGLSMVTDNLVLGLNRLGVSCRVHRHARRSRPGAHVGIIRGPTELCRKIAERVPCAIGPGGIYASQEWPEMFTKSRAICFVQACEWAADIFRPVYGERVKVWPVGIDTERLAPLPSDPKRFDFLVYDKRRWPDTPPGRDLMEPCLDVLRGQGYTWQHLRYGCYPRGGVAAFHRMVRDCRAMLFICENETQGIAYNEVLSLGVPILAWDRQQWFDPERFRFGLDFVAASSVPYFDDRCGLTFCGVEDLPDRLGQFMERHRAGRFSPRDYVLENLGLEHCARKYLELFQNSTTPR
jgi:glycosyltransferase involved in cell wall biosynthesis